MMAVVVVHTMCSRERLVVDTVCGSGMKKGRGAKNKIKARTVKK